MDDEEKVEEQIKAPGPKLSDICNMAEIEKILSDWSNATGMSAIIRDIDHNYITKKHGFTNYCEMMLSSGSGKTACTSCGNNMNFNNCHAGLCDFSIPVTLPDGQTIAYVFCGQVRLAYSDAPDLDKLAADYNLDADKLRTEYGKIIVKSEDRIESSKAVLASMLNTFVEKNYEKWNSQSYSSEDRTLAQITQMLYAYNITLNLETGKYTLITGNGLERAVALYRDSDDYLTVQRAAAKHVHPGYIERLRSLMSRDNLKAIKDNIGYVGTEEFPVIYPDADEYEWHEVNVFISRDNQGTPVANILGRDVTEAHNLQEKSVHEMKAVAAKNQVLSDLTKMLYSYNITLNLNTGKYTLIEGTGMTKFMEIFKSTDDYPTAYAQKVKNILPESLEQFAAIASMEALRGRRKSYGFIGNLEYGVNTENGEEWHEINVFVSTDEFDNPIANILGRDITEVHRRQEQRENAQRASTARDQLLSGITKMLYSFNVTVNLNTWKYMLITGTGCEAWVDVLSSTEDYILAYNKIRRTIDEDSYDIHDSFFGVEALKSYSKRTGYIGTVNTSALINGERKWQENNLFMGTNEYGEPIANILVRDITELHDRSDTKAKLEIAEASSKAKTQFLFNMSHDIRTPMNAIIGFTDLLEKHLDDREVAEQYIDKIKRSNEFLLALINNVLEMAKIESGKETLDEEISSIDSFTESLRSVFSSQMLEKGLHYSVTSHVEHSDVYVDKTKIKEIYLNLISNAMKYTPEGGSVTYEVCEIPCEQEGYALYKATVSDTGIGMSKDYLPRLFDEFSRERNTTESKVMGTGLGMSIVKNLVDLMGGSIEVESEEGKGTTFTVCLKHRIADGNQKEDREDETEVTENVDFAGKRILLAEDNEFNAEIAMEILIDAGFEVEGAADGIICVDMLQKAPAGYYDVILMDVQMPNMDGYSATRVIRQIEDESRKNIPIIAMTANAFDEDRKNALEAGMDGHLAKPIDVEKLIETLARILK